MNILLVMVPLSIILLVGAAIAFFWAVEHDQFDDMDTPALLPMTDLPPEEVEASETDDDAESADEPESREN
ncbi:MAG TPA: cbb3-type cytochrome oxidase assembly protein CcoS [Dokdonella sp.]|uniref:cbb3-type cytochrome oxidase assembly protein CcoS n=1 Tax=Dokdonella sp. TaxID=2291710 RepID=UPI002D7E2D77|nr:cbb3-type cytochrome oxidase assembly protein CcoS [Dokdonella sp.]HET9033625.1 cbb3-type cytochrome oxidase assembly protein CcoS [Dokdonella sp.]